MPHPILARLALAAFVLAPLAAEAADGWHALRRPGTVAILRHALAPGTGDPTGFALGDCSTQRNLDDRGRDQAEQIGEAFRANGIAIDRVLTSEWCRARETAELLDLAPVEPLPALNSFFSDRSSRAAQTEGVRSVLVGAADDERLVLVTHQVNITALTGRPTSSGEMVVFDVSSDGSITVLAEILIPATR